MLQRIALSFLMILITATAQADVLRVEQDGSGDYLLIQDAVDAAASGDTILIGPGRYDDLQYRGTMTGTSVAYWEDGRDLAFIGTEPGEVIIGPNAYEPVGTGPQGLHQHVSADVYVHGLSFENLSSSIVTGQGDLLVSDSSFHTGKEGIWAQDPLFCIVRNCIFSNYSNYSVITFRAQQVVITGCELSDAMVYFSEVDEGILRNCTVSDGGLVRFWLSNGLIEDCVTNCDGIPCIGVIDSDTVRVFDNTILGGNSNMAISGSTTTVIAERNIFSWPEYVNFNLSGSASLFAHNNHIARSSVLREYIVLTSSYLHTQSATVDMGSNYWFADSSPESLDALIYDGNDDMSLNIFVNYEPILTEPVPVEKPSFGGIKAMYR